MPTRLCTNLILQLMPMIVLNSAIILVNDHSVEQSRVMDSVLAQTRLFNSAIERANEFFVRVSKSKNILQVLV